MAIKHVLKSIEVEVCCQLWDNIYVCIHTIERWRGTLTLVNLLFTKHVQQPEKHVLNLEIHRRNTRRIGME